MPLTLTQSGEVWSSTDQEVSCGWSGTVYFICEDAAGNDASLSSAFDVETQQQAPAGSLVVGISGGTGGNILGGDICEIEGQ
jgi:hypothetical protein